MYWEIAGALAGLMALGFGAWYVRARRGRVFVRAAHAAAPSATETLARTIASLDADFERAAAPSADARATYAEQREVLKRKLASALDASMHSP